MVRGSTVPDIAQLLEAQPQMAVGYLAMQECLWTDTGVDPVLLELVRLRICQLHGDHQGTSLRTPAAIDAGLSERQVDELVAWPDSPLFDAAQRCVLAIAELFVIDVHSVTDEAMAELADHVGSHQVVGLMVAMGLFDGFSRFRLVRRNGL